MVKEEENDDVALNLNSEEQDGKITTISQYSEEEEKTIDVPRH